MRTVARANVGIALPNAKIVTAGFALRPIVGPHAI
jgi:hypothetical protein